MEERQRELQASIEGESAALKIVGEKLNWLTIAKKNEENRRVVAEIVEKLDASVGSESFWR